MGLEYPLNLWDLFESRKSNYHLYSNFIVLLESFALLIFGQSAIGLRSHGIHFFFSYSPRHFVSIGVSTEDESMDFQKCVGGWRESPFELSKSLAVIPALSIGTIKYVLRILSTCVWRESGS